jgi:hypothetical protein
MGRGLKNRRRVFFRFMATIHANGKHGKIVARGRKTFSTMEKLSLNEGRLLPAWKDFHPMKERFIHNGNIVSR